MRISDWSSDVCSSDLRLLVGIADRVDHEVDRRPARAKRRKSRIQIVHVGDVAIDQEIAAKFVGEWLHALQHHIALIRNRELGARAVQRLRNAPGKRFIVREAHDQPALALHQTRHFLSPAFAIITSSTRPIASWPKSSTSTSAALSSAPITIPNPTR